MCARGHRQLLGSYPSPALSWAILLSPGRHKRIASCPPSHRNMANLALRTGAIASAAVDGFCFIAESDGQPILSPLASSRVARCPLRPGSLPRDPAWLRVHVDEHPGPSRTCRLPNPPEPLPVSFERDTGPNGNMCSPWARALPSRNMLGFWARGLPVSWKGKSLLVLGGPNVTREGKHATVTRRPRRARRVRLTSRQSRLEPGLTVF